MEDSNRYIDPLGLDQTDEAPSSAAPYKFPRSKGSEGAYTKWWNKNNSTHGNSLDAKGPHDLYAVHGADTGELLRFGETGNFVRREAEHIRNFKKDFGIDVVVTPLRRVEGKAAVKALETRYIKTYEKVFGRRPLFNGNNH